MINRSQCLVRLVKKTKALLSKLASKESKCSSTKAGSRARLKRIQEKKQKTKEKYKTKNKPESHRERGGTQRTREEQTLTQEMRLPTEKEKNTGWNTQEIINTCNTGKQEKRQEVESKTCDKSGENRRVKQEITKNPKPGEIRIWVFFRITLCSGKETQFCLQLNFSQTLPIIHLTATAKDKLKTVLQHQRSGPGDNVSPQIQHQVW